MAISAPALASAPASARTARFYRPELDLLRLLAFSMVWLAHALLSFSGVLPQRWLSLFEGAGSCGVPVFFFLSAYLITELLRREQFLTGTIHLRSFYLRRILRIWPLYFGVLAAYGLLGLRFHGFRIEPGRLAASVFLAGNWYIALHPGITTPLRALWSISVEEQWYVLWPLLRRGFSTRALLVFCGGTIGFSYVLLCILSRFASPSTLHVTAWVNSGVQFQYLALGAAAALLLRGRIPPQPSCMRLLLLGASAAFLLLASDACRFKSAESWHSATSLCAGYFLVGLGTAALFFAFLGIAPERCPRPLVRLGQLSFGLYVFHETGFFFANELTRFANMSPTLLTLVLEKGLALGLTVGLAFLSYYAWELPFLRLKQRWTFVRSREAQ